MAWERAADLGGRLKDLRQALAQSQEEFAELVGVTDQSISDYENERSKPSRNRLERLARQVGIPVVTFEEGGPMPSTLLQRPAEVRSQPEAKSVRESAPPRYVAPSAGSGWFAHMTLFWAVEIVRRELESARRMNEALSPARAEALAAMLRVAMAPGPDAVAAIEAQAAEVVRLAQLVADPPSSRRDENPPDSRSG